MPQPIGNGSGSGSGGVNGNGGVGNGNGNGNGSHGQTGGTTGSGTGSTTAGAAVVSISMAAALAAGKSGNTAAATVRHLAGIFRGGQRFAFDGDGSGDSSNIRAAGKRLGAGFGAKRQNVQQYIDANYTDVQAAAMGLIQAPGSAQAPAPKKSDSGSAITAPEASGSLDLSA